MPTTTTSRPDPPIADNDHHLDPSTTTIDTHTESNEDYLRWKYCMKSISRCEASPGIRASSIYSLEEKHVKKLASQLSRPHTCMKRLVRELRSLSTTLPSEQPNSSIWIRFDEDTPQFMRALMTAPDGTPYAGGLFAFDIHVPNDYPLRPPQMTLLTTGRGSVRFGPNLYADGTICLSLLASWNGPQWNPLSSNLFQLLLSIQGLILGAEQPYYLEPGRGGWEGTVRSMDKKTKEGASMIEVERWMRGKVVRSLPRHVRRYNLYLSIATVQWAMLDHLRRPSDRSQAFQDAIQAHFYCNGMSICNNLRQMCDETPWSARTMRLNSLKNVQLPDLEALIRAIKTPQALTGFDMNDREMIKELESGTAGKSSGSEPSHSLNGVAFQVQIPELVQPGGLFCVTAANKKVMLRCPDDAAPGMSLYFRMHAEDDGQYQFEMLPIVVKAPTPRTDSDSHGGEETPSPSANEVPLPSKKQPPTKSKSSFLVGNSKGQKIAKLFTSFRKTNANEPDEVYA